MKRLFSRPAVPCWAPSPPAPSPAPPPAPWPRKRRSSSSSTGASKARRRSSCVPLAKGYFKDEKLDVTVDAGNGSGGAVTRVASGAYDMGFADLAALMEFHANNPTAPNKPVAVMMVYNNTPAAVLALKKSGIKTPADLNGKKMGAPVFDAGRQAFPIFAKANNIGDGELDRDGPDRCARPCWCAATSTPSPASPSPRCSTSRRAASRPRTWWCCPTRATA